MFPRALGESATSAGRLRLRGPGATIAIGFATVALAAGLAACGGGQRQDATVPSGNFAVQVTKAKFANHQKLADSNYLQLAIRNADTKTIPDLAVTINTVAEGQPNIKSRQPLKQLAKGPTSGAASAATDTFQFGSLAPDQSKDIAWRVTPVRAGTYTVHYEVSASLTGKARAVTPDGSPVRGEFVATISAKPPQSCVTGSGKVTTDCGPPAGG